MALILVVDDDEHNRIVTGEILAHQGHRILRAANGAEALALAIRDRPELIVTDVLMPIMDGFTLCREWMRDERLREVPFLFYTATYTDANDRALGLDLGARHFLIKSPDSSRLVKVVEEVLAANGHAAPSPVAAKEPEAVLHEYNAALVRKLESKMLKLVEVNRALAEESAKRQQAELATRQAMAELHQADKMSTVGQLAAGIAHEISNPLAFILPDLRQVKQTLASMAELLGRLEEPGGVEDLRRESRDHGLNERLDELAEILDGCQAGMDHIRNITRELMQFSRLDGELFEPVRIEELLESSLSIASNLIKYRAEVRRDYQPTPELVVNKGKISQVLLNILVNAAQAIGNQAPAEHRILVSTRSVGEEVQVEIANTGPPIPEAERSRIFDPFFTTKKEHEGTGLGLSISYSIVQQHKGRIDVESDAELTRFIVRLPIDNGLKASRRTRGI